MRTFSLDMIPGGAQTAVACNQYESGDVWLFSLYYDGGRYEIPTGAEVSITGTKPDGAAYKVAGTVESNAVQIVVTDQITACAGRSIAEILVESETDGTTLYSANFPLLVEPAAVQGEFNPSEIPSAIVDTDGNIYYSAEYIPEVSGGVPTEVRQAMKTLFSKAAYIEEGLADEVAVITAWAETTTSITVSPASASVSSASPTAQLSAVTTPAGGAVTWVSSNPTVATVSSTGLVTAVGNGTATITATSGNVSASCAVTVTGFSTLTGIDATYTQSGTVYDTASLDDLKDDLVVTASYDDSSTETITDYTLSGTLAEGTSTITVSYAGLTDTFSVSVTKAPVDTDPVITDYDKYLNNSGAPTSGTGCCCTDYYDMLGTSLVIFTPWTEDSYPRSSLNTVSFNGTTKTHYWNGMSTNSAPKSVSLSAAASDSNKLRFSLFTSGLSSCYAYDSDSGDIYFAGEDSPYYGMSNISEASS